MRWTVTVLIACALAVVGQAPAHAWDPDERWWYEWDEPDPYEAVFESEPRWSEPEREEPVAYEPFAYEPFAYEPVAYESPVPYEPAAVLEPPATYEPPSYDQLPEREPVPPAREEAPERWDRWESPAADALDVTIPPASQAEPTPFAAPEPDARRAELGLHRVTEVHAGDRVTTEGLATRFTSITRSEAAGTSARLVAAVDTGESSSYDGLVFNGRQTLSDGRSVKGEVYANYVWNGYDWVLDRYVFFQDDLEIARLAAPPVPASPPPAPPAVTSPLTTPATSAPAWAPVPIPAPAYVTPIREDAPEAPAPAVPASGPARSPSVTRVVRAGVALAPQADPLGRIEVMRGRRVALWVRATVDGMPANVIAWRLESGELTALGPIGGTGDDPLVATWRSVTGAGSAFAVRLRASVAVPVEGVREIDASIDVVVRSPALVD